MICKQTLLLPARSGGMWDKHRILQVRDDVLGLVLRNFLQDDNIRLEGGKQTRHGAYERMVNSTVNVVRYRTKQRLRSGATGWAPRRRSKHVFPLNHKQRHNVRRVLNTVLAAGEVIKVFIPIPTRGVELNGADQNHTGDAIPACVVACHQSMPCKEEPALVSHKQLRKPIFGDARGVLICCSMKSYNGAGVCFVCFTPFSWIRNNVNRADVLCGCVSLVTEMEKGSEQLRVAIFLLLLCKGQLLLAFVLLLLFLWEYTSAKRTGKRSGFFLFCFGEQRARGRGRSRSRRRNCQFLILVVCAITRQQQWRGLLWLTDGLNVVVAVVPFFLFIFIT
eukprot:PhM_4_TR15183/c2_g1_i1/m.41424